MDGSESATTMGAGFPDPQTDVVLSEFVRIIRGLLGPSLISVVLHGGISFGDLAPGYGDLDFVAVTAAELDDAICERLTNARKPLRTGVYGVLGMMVEGAFLPRKMLDPAVPGRAFWWGTSGERPWDRNKLGWFVCKQIRERGVVVWGEDVRRAFADPKPEDLLSDVLVSCEQALTHGEGGSLHSVDWLLTAARSLYWLERGVLSSKSEAADWGAEHAHGRWCRLLPRAKELRLNPSLYGAADTKDWVADLTEPIREAWLEVRAVARKAERGCYGEHKYGTEGPPWVYRGPHRFWH